MIYKLNQNLSIDGATALQDTGTEFSGSANVAIDETIPAYGESAQPLAGLIPLSGLKCIFAIATVACTLDMNDTDDPVSLEANILKRIEPTADCDEMEVSANTVNGGAAGTLKLRALYDATP